jgi:hypothetical protein
MNLLKFRNIFLLLLFFVGSIHAETVLLRNGSILRGKLKSQSINDIVIIIDSKEQKVSKDKVFRVLYRDMSQSEAKKAMLAEIKKLNPKDREKLLSEIKDKSIVSEVETKPTTEKPAKEEVVYIEEPSPVVKPEPSKEATKVGLITKWGLVWRTALIPGWGHIHAKNYKTGIFYGFVFFGAGIFAASMSRQMNGAIAERDEKVNTSNAVTLFGGSIESALLLYYGGSNSSTQDDQRIFGYRALLYTSLGVMTGVYIIQLINVYVLGSKIEKSKEVGFNFYIAPEVSPLSKEIGTQQGVSYTFRF